MKIETWKESCDYLFWFSFIFNIGGYVFGIWADKESFGFC